MDEFSPFIFLDMTVNLFSSLLQYLIIMYIVVFFALFPLYMMCLLCPLIFRVFLGLPLLATKLTSGLGL